MIVAIYSRFLKVYIFGSILRFKVKFKVKHCVKYYKNIENICKAAFNVFLNKMMTNNFYLYMTDFLSQNEITLPKMLKS